MLCRWDCIRPARFFQRRCWNWGEKQEIHQRDQRFGVWVFWGPCVMGLVGFAWFGCLTCCDCCRKTIWKLQRYHIHKKKHGFLFGEKQSFLAGRDLPRALVYVLIQSCGTKMTWIVCHVPALAWRVWECNGCAVIQNAVFVFLLI